MSVYFLLSILWCNTDVHEISTLKIFLITTNTLRIDFTININQISN